LTNSPSVCYRIKRYRHIFIIHNKRIFWSW